MRDLKKSTNSQETRKIRKILNEEARLGISPNSDSETEEVDLQKELYPLGHYINNREEMIEQMFSIIRGAKLKKMLPPILKDMPFDELKADCLIHLLGMSKKRIRAILDGREINSSSGSESHSDSSTTPSKKPKVDLKPFIIKQEGCSDISDNSEEVVLVDPDLDFLDFTCNNKKTGNTAEEKIKSKRKQKRKDLDKKHKRTKTKEVEQVSESDEVQQIESSAESVSEDETETQAPKEGKTLLEILELEMRARAIRALLKNNDTQEGDESQNTVDNQTPKHSKEKSHKQLNEEAAEKITPAKNFRKKKRKSDDVIVIAPKLVTIDLTDENEQSNVENNKDGDREENAPSSSQSNSLDDKSQEVVLNDAQQTSNEINQSLISEKISEANEELLKKKTLDISEMVDSCSDGKASKIDSLDKTVQSERGKSSWAQRWLESKEVKKVVSTSKICGNIRKKIKIAKLAKKEKQMQDEPVNTSPAPQQKMEGSVVEYELLLKSKTPHADIDGANDDTQVSVSSANQELTSSETDLTETPSADQVQDISSTKAENPSALVKNTVSDLQVDEEKTSTAEIELGDSDGVGIVAATPNIPEEELSSNTNDKETDVPFTDDGEVETSEPKSLKNDDKNIKNENINSTTETEPNKVILNSENKNLVENKEKGENLKFPQEGKSSGNVNTEAQTTKGSDEHNDTLPNNENCTTIFESDISLTDEPVINLETSVDNKNELDSNNENGIERNSECKQSKTNQSEVSEMLETVVSVCSTKSTQEPNEPEALEINITEEDRDIEDVIEESTEQSLSKHVNDSIIEID